MDITTGHHWQPPTEEKKMIEEYKLLFLSFAFRLKHDFAFSHVLIEPPRFSSCNFPFSSVSLFESRIWIIRKEYEISLSRSLGAMLLKVSLKTKWNLREDKKVANYVGPRRNSWIRTHDEDCRFQLVHFLLGQNYSKNEKKKNVTHILSVFP